MKLCSILWTALFASVLLLTPVEARADNAGTATPVSGVYQGSDSAGVHVQIPEPVPTTAVYAATQDVNNALLPAKSGDLVTLTFADPKQTTLATKVDITRPVGTFPAILAICAGAFILLLFAGLVTKWKPQSFLIGLDGRFSNSQTQIVLWFGAVMTIYFAFLFLRIIYLGKGFVGGIGLTTNLIALSGLSGFTFGAARVIRQSQAQAATAAGQAQAAPQPVDRSLLNYVQNDKGQADIGDFEMLLITVIAVGVFIYSAFFALAQLDVAKTIVMPDVDTTLLSIFGIGQGAYLVKKAGSPPGSG